MTHAPNLASWERWASSLAGAALLLAMARRPVRTAALVAVGGVFLLGRGLSGRCPLSRALGLSSRAALSPDESAVDAASDMSFPASDPPAWTPTRSGHPAIAD